LTGAERSALRPLWRNTDLTILPADMDNASVLLNTVDYIKKIGVLQDPAYSRCAKDPMETIECKI
jgi:hypothetical protein